MSDPSAAQDVYTPILAELIQRYLQGEFLSLEMLQDALQERLDNLITTGTIPQADRVEIALIGVEAELEQARQDADDEFQQVKLDRRLKALKMLTRAWAQLQAQYQATTDLSAAVASITSAPPEAQLAALVAVLDQNRSPGLTPKQTAQLAEQLLRRAQTLDKQSQLLDLSQGLTHGLASCRKLQDELMGWAIEGGQRAAGFGQGVTPWEFWARKLMPPPPQAMASVGFMGLDTSAVTLGSPSLPQACLQALGQSTAMADWAAQASTAIRDWVELIVLLQGLQQRLVQWFDNQAYDPKVGPKLSISTFWTFASLWCNLAQGLSGRSSTLSAACFQLSLQVLRAFAQQPYFPLYGRVVAAFGGGYLQTTLDYLDVPLNQVEKTQEKARILTLLGYSQRALGHIHAAFEFHQQALTLARSAEDVPCEIANLNHLSRTHMALTDYGAAIDTSQRALLLSRQTGDRLGEVNALANLGYSQVLGAEEQGAAEPDSYEQAISYLQRGLQLAIRFEDLHSQALCQTSLGMAYLVMDQPAAALPTLQAGLQAAQAVGDLYLRGLTLAQLAVAHRALQEETQTLYCGCLGMYLLHQIQAPEWQQPAYLLRTMQRQVGIDRFAELVEGLRSQFIPEIGVDGYDALVPLLASSS